MFLLKAACTDLVVPIEHFVTVNLCYLYIGRLHIKNKIKTPHITIEHF